MFRRFVARKDIAIILINQPIAEQIRPTMNEYTASIPAVLEIPSSRIPYDHSKVRGGGGTKGRAQIIY